MSLYNERELGPIRNCRKLKYPNVLDIPIYQYLPFEYALQVVESRKIRFGNIWDSWEDSYELFMHKQEYIYNGVSISDKLQEQGSNTYGQCWSLTKETDAMWRIYSPQKNSVRIQTTIGKMIQVLDQTRGMTEIEGDKVVASYQTSFGFVRYRERQVIDRWIVFHQNIGLMELFEKCLNSCFIKRNEFSHENEFRFIISTHNFSNSCNPIIHRKELFLPITLESFIDEIVFDPRLSEDSYRQNKSKLLAKCNSLNITKSQLYDFSKNTILIVDKPIQLKAK